MEHSSQDFPKTKYMDLKLIRDFGHSENILYVAEVESESISQLSLFRYGTISMFHGRCAIQTLRNSHIIIK